MKKNRTVNWEKTEHIVSYGMEDKLIYAIWDTVAVLLLVFSGVTLLSLLSDTVKITVGLGVHIAGVVLMTILLYEVGLRTVLQKIKARAVRVLLSLLCMAGSVLFVGRMIWRDYLAEQEEINAGILSGVDSFLVIYNRIYGTNYVIGGGREYYLPQALAFLTVVIFLALYLLSGFGKWKWIYVLVPVASLSIVMYVGQSPRWPQIFMFAMGVYMLAESRHRKKAGVLPKWSRVALLVWIGFLSVILFNAPMKELFRHAEQARVIERKIESNIANSFKSGGDTPGGKLRNRSPQFRDAQVMTVHVDKRPMGSLYFKTFYSETYQDGEWLSPEESYNAFCEQNGIDADMLAGMLMQRVFKCTNLRRMKYEVEYKRLFGKDMLLPYGVDPRELSDIDYRGDSLFLKDALTQKLTFQGPMTNAVSGEHLMFNMDWDSAEEQKVMEQYGQHIMDVCAESIKSDTEWLDAFGASDVHIPLDSLPFESLFIYDEETGYYEVDEAKTDILYYWFSTCIADYLTMHYRYSWNLDEIDETVDPVIYFLTQGKKGYCMHFASAAVLLMRTYGVPARYASGYILKPSMFKEQEDGTFVAEVLDRNAHAWAEIYLSDIGWIPIEVTPGYQSDTESFPASREEQEKREQEEQKNSATPTPAAPTMSPSPSPEVSPTPQPTVTPAETEKPKVQGNGEPDDKNQGDGDSSGTPDPEKQRLLVIILLIAGTAVTALCVRSVVRYNEKKKLEKALNGRYYKAAILLINRRIYRKVCILKKVTDDKEYEAELCRYFGDECCDMIARYMDVVKEAAFSQGNLDKKGFLVAWKLYRKLKRKG